MFNILCIHNIYLTCDICITYVYITCIRYVCNILTKIYTFITYYYM